MSRNPFTSGESDNTYWLNQDRDEEREPRPQVLRFKSAEDRRRYFAGKGKEQ
jgi:hypothetical protein